MPDSCAASALDGLIERRAVRSVRPPIVDLDTGVAAAHSLIARL